MSEKMDGDREKISKVKDFNYDEVASGGDVEKPPDISNTKKGGK